MPATVVRAIRVRRAMRSPAATSRLISRPASRSITTKTARGTRKGAERRARRLFFAYRPTACAAGSSDERRFTMSGATTVGGSSVTRSFSPRGVISNMRRRQQQCRDNLSATPARGICISCHAGSVPHIAQSTLALALQDVFLGTKPPRIGKVPDSRLAMAHFANRRTTLDSGPSCSILGTSGVIVKLITVRFAIRFQNARGWAHDPEHHPFNVCAGDRRFHPRDRGCRVVHRSRRA